MLNRFSISLIGGSTHTLSKCIIQDSTEENYFLHAPSDVCIIEVLSFKFYL